jgi:hypothetical protein
MSDCILTFIVPLRHPQNSTDWPALKRRLAQTIRSIAGQDDDRWQAVIVANEGSDLPEMPRNFRVKNVRFPPNPMYEQGSNDRETFLDSLRFDKGRRVLAGMLDIDRTGHSMVVDDDDFVSCRLTSFVAAHRGENGWYVQDGYIWGDGGRLLYEHGDFWSFCGTSHIIRTALYQLPERVEDATFDYIRRTFGGHVRIRGDMAALGTPLAPLPFAGAVYRIGHADAHSKSPGLLRHVFLRREILKNPLKLAQRFFRLRLVSAEKRRQFWGPSISGEIR